ncbi:MAG: PucR family transcriptional regulator [Kurthia sp.]|nr:PucR family transcriptional regulator [Candidatus Kurthia equi]
MAMTVKNFLELPITKEFQVITGHQQLQRTMKNVEILDFEFLRGFEQIRDSMFTENSLVLTSLLFAKNEPELLRYMVDELVRFNVSALAFKAVIYEELPQEVIALAESKGLVILKFGGDEFFEDIIFQAMDYRNKIAQTEFLQTTLTTLIENDVTQEQLQTLRKQINKPFEAYIYVAAIKSSPSVAENLFRFEPFLRTGLIGQYKGHILIAMTNQSKEYNFKQQMQQLLALFDFHSQPIFMGESDVLKTSSNLHEVMQQAYYSSLLAEVYGVSSCSYVKLTTDKLLIELIKKQPQFVKQYINTYIAPLLSEENQLLDTAIDYVLLQGNIKAVADRQYCHANTIRYRLNKLRLLTNKELTEFSFFEELSVAIKLYLIQKQVEKDVSL